jgi:hypothetical protein
MTRHIVELEVYRLHAVRSAMSLTLQLNQLYLPCSILLDSPFRVVRLTQSYSPTLTALLA